MPNLKDTSVKFLGRDFAGFKQDLMRYAQAHFSGAFQDFNEASPGMLILELQAYVGDVLGFYLDQQFLEIKANTARQLENIEDFAKMRGYKPKGPRPARVGLDWIVEVPAAAGSDGSWIPDSDYLPTIRAGSQAGGPAGTVFETIEDLDLAVSTPDNQQIVVASRFDDDQQPTHFAVKRSVSAVAGTTVVESISVGDFVPYKRVQLGQSDVEEVLDVFDREGQQWYEVDYLAQNVVFDQVVNTGSDSSTVPYVLKWRSASRRFVLDQSVAANASFLQFGPGDGLKFDDELVPNIANLALPIQGRPQFTNFTLDPQNFLQTRSLGLSPFNTVLTVRYRVGGGVQTNVPALSIDKAQAVLLSFRKTVGPGALDAGLVAAVRSSVEVTNPLASEGGGDAETAAEIRANAASFFAAQARAVTREDFVTHVLSMPVRFGRAEKVYVKNSDFNPLGVDLHVLSLDPNGHFQKPTDTLRQNIKTYMSRLRMLTEGITVLNAFVVNLGVNFGVVVSPRFNRSEVLTNCLVALRNYLHNDNMQIGMPLVSSDLRAVLQNITGVISVYKFDFVSKYGTPYSADIHFDVSANTQSGILSPPPDTIFEVRFPEQDLVGESR